MSAQNTADREALDPEVVARSAAPWQVVDGDLRVRLRFPTFLEAIDFVGEAAKIAEAHDHHPDIDIRYRTLAFSVRSHDVDALTVRDVRLARAITELGERFGAEFRAPVDGE